MLFNDGNRLPYLYVDPGSVMCCTAGTGVSVRPSGRILGTHYINIPILTFLVAAVVVGPAATACTLLRPTYAGQPAVRCSLRWLAHLDAITPFAEETS